MRRTPPEAAAFLAALEETQYLAPRRLKAYQRRLLEILLRHARAETDFYRERLRPLFRTDGSIDWEGWEEVPILGRRDVQEHFSALVARTLPPVAGHVMEDTSSGSTGTPVRHLVTDMQAVASNCCSERFFRWHGLKTNALTARIRATDRPEAAYPGGRLFSPWRYGHEESRGIDLSIRATAAQQVEWLERIRPDYLMSYPSNLREVARQADAAGRSLCVEAILTVGEAMSEDMRAALRAGFGREPLDRYGASEVGHIGGTCPHSGGHHVAAELVLLEIVGPEGQPVEPGCIGRVIVTPFYGLAMPLIRYELGDYAAIASEPCACGRTLPLMERVLGRSRNVFHFNDGTSRWPVCVSAELRKFVPNRQFQVVQRSLTELDFRYVPATDGQANDLAGLESYFRATLHPSLTVRLTALQSIPRPAGGKFEDYVSLVQ